MKKIKLLTVLLLAQFVIGQTKMVEYQTGHVVKLSVPDYMTRTSGLNDDACLEFQNAVKELKRMRDVKMTSSQLAAAKKQLIGQIGVASDNFENNALGMAKTFLHYHKYESSELVFKRIEALTAETLLEVANEMFAEEYLSTLIYK
jgi:hypothetical protein